MRKIKCVNPWKHQAQKVYQVDGLATTLSANGGGQGGKTGLYLVSDMDKKVIDENFTEVEDGKFITTERERVVMRLPLAHAVDLCQRSRIIMFWKRLLGLLKNTLQGLMEVRVLH